MKILIKCHTSDSTPVFITGGHPSLGEWDTARALAMQLQVDGQDARSWSAVLDLEPGSTIEYKFVKKGQNGVEWENGWNRTYTAVPGISSISDTFRT